MISFRQADLLDKIKPGTFSYAFEYDSIKWEIHANVSIDNPQAIDAQMIHNLAVGVWINTINSISPFDRQIEGTSGNHWVVRFGQIPVDAWEVEDFAKKYYANLTHMISKHFEILETDKGNYSGWVKYKLKPETMNNYI
jgi:hypothetical protein